MQSLVRVGITAPSLFTASVHYRLAAGTNSASSNSSPSFTALHLMAIYSRGHIYCRVEGLPFLPLYIYQA